MTRTSKRYAQEVTDRIDRVIRSIRSQSPVLRSSSPVLRSSYVYTTASPVSVYTSTVPTVTVYNNTGAISAVNEISRIDNTCRALIAENDILRDQVYIQTDLIEENSRVNRDLSKVALENEILRTENRRVDEYEQKVHSLLRQSQEVNIQLGQQARETTVWRAKFDEADVNGARYRTLYQGALSDNERLKAEVVELRAQLTRESLLKSEITRLQSQNEELVALRLRLSQELVLKGEEVTGLRVNLREIDVLSSKLTILEQDNSKLRSIVSIQADTALELKAVAQECDVFRSKLSISESENGKLRGLVSSQADNIVELKNVVVELEGLGAKLTVAEADNRRYREVIASQNDSAVELRRKIDDLNVTITQLRVEVSTIAGLEEKLALTTRGGETLTRMISEKETVIVNLHRDIANLRVEISGLNKEILSLNVAVEQNASYRRQIERLLVESDELKLKLARLIEVEQRLLISQKDSESLTLSLSSKLETIRELHLRIAHLEEQMLALEQLKSKVVLVVAENERLNSSISEQSTIILEWSEKYYNLEKLYLTVKESTEQLDVIKNKFQRAVKETEVTHNNLRNSYYNVVKTTLYDSKVSTYSDAKTAGSPTDILSSPVAARSYSRTASPGRV